VVELESGGRRNEPSLSSNLNVLGMDVYEKV
jgi:hypothetical protein